MSISKYWRLPIFILGFLTPVFLTHFLPPAPPFSPVLGRATYHQSYETSYFSSVRGYENLISKAYAAGEIPLIVFGDSSIRGTGASKDRVWTTRLEKDLRKIQPNIRVINFAQNAGDLVGPFLYHHLYTKFPNAYYIVQWNYPAQVGVRHPFHYWLTSEILLRDGNKNPVVKKSYEVVRLLPNDLTIDTFKNYNYPEIYSLLLAGLNIGMNYLDAGNWMRYLAFGRLYTDEKKKIIIEPLKNAPESDIDYFNFKIIEEDSAKMMRHIYKSLQKARHEYLQTPVEDRKKYFDEIFPIAMRDHLLLLTIDLNPYYASSDGPDYAKIMNGDWSQIKSNMSQIPKMNWLALTASMGDMTINDYMDLGHLTPQGQEKLSLAVDSYITNRLGWFPVKETVK